MKYTADTVVVAQEPEKLPQASPDFAEVMEFLDRIGWNAAPLAELRTASLWPDEEQQRFIETVVAEEHFFDSVLLDVVREPHGIRGSERFHHPCWEQVDHLRVALYLLRGNAPAEVTGRWLNESVRAIEKLNPTLQEIALELIIDLLLATSPAYQKTVEKQWDPQHAEELWISLIHRQQRPIISQDDPLQIPVVLVNSSTHFRWERHMNFFLGHRNHWGDPKIRQPREVIFDRRLDWFRATLFSYEDRPPFYSHIELITKDQHLSAEDRGVLLRDGLNGYREARKPEPVKAWAEFLLDSLEISDEEIVAHSHELVPLLFRKDSTSLLRFGTVLAQKGSEDILTEVITACLTLAGRATRIKVLNAAARRDAVPSPDILEQCQFLLEDALAMDEHPQFSKAVDKLAAVWNLNIEEPGTEATGDASLWQKAPVLWQIPDLTPSDTPLVELAAHELERFGPAIAAGNRVWSWFRDVESEQFTDALVRCAYSDLEATKISLVGVPRASKSLEGIREWVTGELALYLKSSDRSKREAEILELLGSVPILLSTPDREDLTIGVETILDRLAEYAQAQAPVGPIDLSLALLRIRGDRNPVISVLQSSPLLLHTRGEEEKVTVGAAMSSLVFQEPSVDTEWVFPEVEVTADEGGRPQKITHRIVDFLTSGSCFDFLPSTAEQAFLGLDYTYRSSLGTGLLLRQLARSSSPFTPAAAINFLAALSNLHTRESEVGWTAASEAWYRGLLIPGVPNIAHLGWNDTPPQRLGSLAKTFRDLAYMGMLALVWPILKDLVDTSAQQDKPLTGTPDLLQVIAELLPHVMAAVDEGRAEPSHLDLPGVRELVARSGKTRAIVLAREILDRLPHDDRVAAGRR